jgi:hypothetical protein
MEVVLVYAGRCYAYYVVERLKSLQYDMTDRVVWHTVNINVPLLGW